MGIGVSLILIAVGAILYWAVNASPSGIELETVGLILMVIGGISFLLSLAFWSTWGGWRPVRGDTTVVRETDRMYGDRY